ncbi:MAG: bifunctional pyr operon transcriptional regulator/uracil phosphoribosyltransferase PyrR [Deferrisomatales bacterium]|nr:bifunctional pyr operon transcriptional regulator/uracil phosphoribosyltransferase PyrR [Deferrisomatales bacterium]
MAEKYRRMLLDSDGVRRVLARMAAQILEASQGIGELALVGIVSQGDVLARRLCEHIRRVEDLAVPNGRLDITLYRDDIARSGATTHMQPTEIPFSVKDRTVVLVDDVLYTGRTVRAAMDALMDIGRPRAIQLAVLVDRGHRELPIQPDYVGQVMHTRRDEEIEVRLAENPEDDAVFLLEPATDWTGGED